MYRQMDSLYFIAKNKGILKASYEYIHIYQEVDLENNLNIFQIFDIYIKTNEGFCHCQSRDFWDLNF